MTRYTTITFCNVNCLRCIKEFKTHSITLRHCTKQGKQYVNTGPWCCFWAMGYLKREAISKCSDCTHVARFPPWDPILSCLNMMLPCMHSNVTIWLCKFSLWLANTNSQGRLICTAYLAMHWWSCSTPYLPGPTLQPLNSREKNIFKHYSELQEKTNTFTAAE